MLKYLNFDNLCQLLVHYLRIFMTKMIDQTHKTPIFSFFDLVFETFAPHLIPLVLFKSLLLEVSGASP